MDMSDTLAPKSDQLDAVDLLGGPRIFTVTKVDVKKGAEQPVQIYLAEFDRPWRPGVNMRRVIVAAWGPEGSAYVGRRVELFCDKSVVFGGKEVGGVRISRMSHLDRPVKAPQIISSGRAGIFTVQPLPDAPEPTLAQPVEPTEADVAACTDTEQLRGMWQVSGDERRAQIQARVAELQATPAGDRVPDDGTPEPDDGFLLSGSDQ